MPNGHNIYAAEVSVTMREKGLLAASKKLSQVSKKMKQDLQLEAGVIKPTKEFQQLGKTINQAEAELKKLNRERDRLAKQHKSSDEYKKLAKDITVAEQRLDRLVEQQIAWSELGISAKDSNFQRLGKEIETTRANLVRMKNDLQGMAETGATDKEAKEWFDIATRIDKAEKELDQYKAKRDKMEANGSAFTDQKPPSAARMIKDSIKARGAILGGMIGNTKAGSAITGIFGQMKTKLSGIGGTGKKAFTFLKGVRNDAATAGSKLGELRKRILSTRIGGKIFGGISKKLRGVGNSANFVSKHLKKMKRGLAMGTGIKGLARLGLAGAGVYAMIRGLRQGFENLQGYSTQTANDISVLRGSLLTCKNAMATAFAPILSAIVPILQKLIGWVTAAATAIAHFTAALTGKSSVAIAKPMGAVASGASSAAGATGDANKAAKEYQRTLMGFDKINKLEAPTKDTGSGGGGGGGGGAGAGSMFETVDVSSGAKNLAKKIKEAWAKADFTEIGAMLGNKLNSALAKIPWGKIQNTAKKIGKSIATFLNGFIASTNWNLVGQTIANGLNTAIYFAQSFVENFKWYKFGKKIAAAVSSFFKNTDWKTLAKTIGNGIAGALKSIAGFFENLDWSGIADSLWDFVSNIPYGKIAKWLFRALGAAIGGLARFGIQLFKNVGKSVQKGFSKGVKEGFKSIGRWIKNNIFKPFINGFKKAFGIASPSKEMKKQGEYVIEGLLEGLKDKISSVTDWFKELPGKFLEAMGNFGEKLSGFIGDAVDGLGNIGQTIKNKVGDIAISVSTNLDNIKNNTIKMTAEFVDWIKSGGFKNTVTNMISSFASWVKGTKFGQTVTNMVAGFTSWIKGTKFGQTISGFTAKLTSWARGFWKKDMVMSGFRAIVDRWRSAIKGERNLYNFRAWVSKFVDKINAQYKVLYGFQTQVATYQLKPKAEGGVYSSGRWKPITAAASGGAFSQGQMFIAREGGPEMVGRIGTSTAVMNNDQIVSSVAAGVAQAVASVMRGNSQAVNVYLQGDAGQMFKIVRQKATDYTRATGQPAFPV